MMGAESVSTMLVAPTGSRNSSADALRVSVGSEDPSLGSESEAAAKESAAVSPAVTMTVNGQRRPFCQVVLERVFVRSGLSGSHRVTQ